MKDEKTSLRLSSEQMEALDEICKKNDCSRGKVIRDAIDMVTKNTNQDSAKESKKSASAKIISIDGIPIEKFQSGEYKIENDSNGKSRVVKVGIIDQAIAELFGG